MPSERDYIVGDAFSYSIITWGQKM